MSLFFVCNNFCSIRIYAYILVHSAFSLSISLIRCVPSSRCHLLKHPNLVYPSLSRILLYPLPFSLRSGLAVLFFGCPVLCLNQILRLPVPYFGALPNNPTLIVTVCNGFTRSKRQRPRCPGHWRRVR